ncbi:TlpA family protein disulfide reductase [Halovenus salina]|uniref:TlpA family protein disulfide reductase n=1 Tax=Halovenus salina TaxID=1510225 RepID=UPI002260B1FA|nr:thioredoxin domain-containing protein [Halovenus salina]
MTDERTRRGVLLAAGATAALAGCLGGGDDGEDTTADDGRDTDTGDGSSADWQSVTLMDATADEEFSIAETDQPVVLHTFATWCSTCRRQQGSLADAYDRNGDDVTFVDVTIDENDDPDDLRSHAEENGFGWRFAVAPAEMTRGLVDQFGQRVAVAPQSPVILVCPDGSTTELDKGVSASEIESALDENCR